VGVHEGGCSCFRLVRLVERAFVPRPVPAPLRLHQLVPVWSLASTGHPLSFITSVSDYDAPTAVLAEGEVSEVDDEQRRTAAVV
jgi:hypothetical protein